MDEYDRLDAELYDHYSTGVEGELEFYRDEAVAAQGPVLELGCGTGRILIPAAAAGARVLGLDRAPAMLAVARRKLAAQPEDVRLRVELVQGDMRGFSLGRRFALITIPYRAFLHLLTVAEQRMALACVREHLAEGGRLILNVFDPSLEILSAHLGPLGEAQKRDLEFVHPESGHRYLVWDTRRLKLDEQVIEQYFIFEELDGDGRSLGRTFSRLTLRYVYRWELQHLLELCGFEVMDLFGDFYRGPYHHGREQIWIARAR